MFLLKSVRCLSHRLAGWIVFSHEKIIYRLSPDHMFFPPSSTFYKTKEEEACRQEATIRTDPLPRRSMDGRPHTPSEEQISILHENTQWNEEESLFQEVMSLIEEICQRNKISLRKKKSVDRERSQKNLTYPPSSTTAPDDIVEYDDVKWCKRPDTRSIASENAIAGTLFSSNSLESIRELPEEVGQRTGEWAKEERLNIERNTEREKEAGHEIEKNKEQVKLTGLELETERNKEQAKEAGLAIERNRDRTKREAGLELESKRNKKRTKKKAGLEIQRNRDQVKLAALELEIERNKDLTKLAAFELAVERNKERWEEAGLEVEIERNREGSKEMGLKINMKYRTKHTEKQKSLCLKGLTSAPVVPVRTHASTNSQKSPIYHRRFLPLHSDAPPREDRTMLPHTSRYSSGQVSSPRLPRKAMQGGLPRTLDEHSPVKSSIANTTRSHHPDSRVPPLPDSSIFPEVLQLEGNESVPVNSLYRSLMNKEYFHLVARKAVGEMLTENGMFLVRPSTHSQHLLTLSVSSKGKIFNIVIRCRSDSKFALGSEKQGEIAFSSVEDMIRFYKREPIKVQDGSLVYLRRSPQK